MAWLYLVVAGLFEIGWPLGLKKGWGPDGVQAWWLLFAIVTMAVSGALLMLAQRAIPMGTAYAVWTGIGAAGSMIIGMLIYSEPTDPVRILCLTLIVAGMVGLKLNSPV